MTDLDFQLGEAVKVIDAFSGRECLVCTGNVERLTATLVIVRNQHGNLTRFRRRDGRMVGYAWPYLTHQLRKNP